MDKIPSIGGLRGVFEIWIPGVFLLVNFVAFAVSWPVTASQTNEIIEKIKANEAFLNEFSTLLVLAIFGYLVGVVSGQIKWTEMAPINGTGEKQKEARGGPLEKKQGQLT